jgi:hypothetical protein
MSDRPLPLTGPQREAALDRVRALTLDLRDPIDKRTRRLLKAERRDLHERLGWRRR